MIFRCFAIFAGLVMLVLVVAALWATVRWPEAALATVVLAALWLALFDNPQVMATASREAVARSKTVIGELDALSTRTDAVIPS